MSAQATSSALDKWKGLGAKDVHIASRAQLSIVHACITAIVTQRWEAKLDPKRVKSVHIMGRTTTTSNPTPGNSVLRLLLDSATQQVGQGYDQNGIIWPEPETDPELQFRLSGRGRDSENFASGYTKWNWYAQIPVPVLAGYGPIPEKEFINDKG